MALLVEVLQVEQSCPEQFLGGRVVGDEVYGERGLRDPVDGPIVEDDAVEQQEHAEADHDDGQPPIAVDVYSHVVPEQRQCYGGADVQQEKPRPVPIISQTCLVVNGSMYHL